MIRVGTRGSALALTQARWVAERIEGETELVTINATGPVDDKSRWVSELERALLEDRIVIAVHSAKDVPAELAGGLELIAIPPRERSPRCDLRRRRRSRRCQPAPASGRAACAGARRCARCARTSTSQPVRGNVDTRLRKLREGECDALVLAAAGLRRLGLEPDGLLEDLVPAAGQGALAIEARSGRDARPSSSTFEATQAWPPSARSSTRWAPHATPRSARTRGRATPASWSYRPGWDFPTARNG